MHIVLALLVSMTVPLFMQGGCFLGLRTDQPIPVIVMAIYLIAKGDPDSASLGKGYRDFKLDPNTRLLSTRVWRTLMSRDCSFKEAEKNINRYIFICRRDHYVSAGDLLHKAFIYFAKQRIR